MLSQLPASCTVPKNLITVPQKGVFIVSGRRNKERVNRTRMTRIERIDADLRLALSAMIRRICVIRVLLTRASM
jgi:hypothetical protein